MTGCAKAHKHWKDYADQIGARIESYTGTGEQCHVFDELFWKDPEAAILLEGR